MVSVRQLEPDTNYDDTQDAQYAPDAIDFIDGLIATGVDPWEAATDIGRAAAADMDGGRWVIGDLAARIRKRYKEDRIGDFAKAINVEAPRVREYRRVALFYEKSHRQHFEGSGLSYSHFREAMRFKDLGYAHAFLMDCAEYQWPIEAARLELNARLGKKPPPRILIDAKLTAEPVANGVKFVIAEGKWLLSNATALFQPGHEYHITVREVTP